MNKNECTIPDFIKINFGKHVLLYFYSTVKYYFLLVYYMEGDVAFWLEAEFFFDKAL